MPYDSLSDFLSERQDENDLVRIAAQVDPELELAEITSRAAIENDGPVLLFENIAGSEFPLVTNLLGSHARICRALDATSFEEVANRISGLIQPDLPEGMTEALKLIPQFTKLAQIRPATVKAGRCQQVVKMGRDVDLNELPIPRCWPNDANRSLTAAQLVSQDPQHDSRHVALTRLQRRDGNSLLVHWTLHDAAWTQYLAYREQRRQMPLAIALGGDPVLAFASAAGLPTHVDPYVFAGFLRGKNVELVKCRSNDLQVPTSAEFVIEGFIDTEAELEHVTSLGNDTGFYGVAEKLPVMNVTAVTHNANPVFPAIVPGATAAESYWMGKAAERLFWPLVKLAVPEIVDYHLPASGLNRNFAFVSIDKQYPQQARKVMHALWGLGRLAMTKFIIVVDADVDVHHEHEVWRHVGTNCHPNRDTLICEGPIAMDDHAAPVRGRGAKMGIDATRKCNAEGHHRDWPDAIKSNAEIADRVTQRWSEFGLDTRTPREASDS